MIINLREIDNAILAILAMFGTNAKDCNDCYDCGLRVWEKRNLWAPPLLLKHQPTAPSQVLAASFKAIDHWTV
jgi:hypothetical protein